MGRKDKKETWCAYGYGVPGSWFLGKITGMTPGGSYVIRYYKNQIYSKELWGKNYVKEFKTRKLAEAFILKRGGSINYD